MSRLLAHQSWSAKESTPPPSLLNPLNTTTHEAPSRETTSETEKRTDEVILHDLVQKLAINDRELVARRRNYSRLLPLCQTTKERACVIRSLIAGQVRVGIKPYERSRPTPVPRALPTSGTSSPTGSPSKAQAFSRASKYQKDIEQDIINPVLLPAKGLQDTRDEATKINFKTFLPHKGFLHDNGYTTRFYLDAQLTEHPRLPSTSPILKVADIYGAVEGHRSQWWVYIREDAKLPGEWKAVASKEVFRHPVFKNFYLDTSLPSEPAWISHKTMTRRKQV